MGLMASNARLQTLYARLADIEFRGQQINNTRLQIASQEANLSQQYSTALNTTVLMSNVVNAATGAVTPTSLATLVGTPAMPTTLNLTNTASGATVTSLQMIN